MTNRTKAILGLGSVFLIGSLCGALVVGIVVRDHVKEAENFRQREGFLRFFERKLDLSEAQRDSLNDELRYVYERLHELRRSTSEQYSALLDTLRQTIYPKLRPDQQELFTRQEERMRHAFPSQPGDREIGRRPPPPMRGMLPRDEWLSGSEAPLAQLPPRAAPRHDSVSTRVPLASPPIEGGKAPTEAESPLPSTPPANSSNPGELLNLLKQDGKFEKHLGRLRRHLLLNDDQMAAIRLAIEDARSRFHAGQAEFPDDPMRRRMMRKEIVHDVKQKITSILTPDQRIKMMELMQRHHNRDTSDAR